MKWFIWKNLLLGYNNQLAIAKRAGCSPQYVSKACAELAAKGFLSRKAKNKVVLTDSRALLFRLAVNWRMPEPLIIDLPLKTRGEVSEFLRKEGVNHAFTLKGLSVWVDRVEKLKKYEGRKGFLTYENPWVVIDKKDDDAVDDVQLFCDYFSKGGFGIDLALNHGVKTGLLSNKLL